MFMEGPKNIPLDPSMTMGPAAVKRVSRNGGGSAGGVNPKGSEGHPVTNGGKSEAAGRALLEMMAGNNIVPTNGFFKRKDSVKDGANIETHPTALFTHGPEADGKLQQVMNLASRGAVPGAGIINSEIIKQALILDAKANGIPIGINTKEATQRLVQLFHAQPD